VSGKCPAIIPASGEMSYQLIEKQVIYQGQKVHLELHRLLNQETEKRHTREVCVHPGAVVVLGFLDDDRIILIRSYRYAIGQYLFELPAGTLEKGEKPMNCAGRELLEETGYLAGRLQPLLNFFTSPGILSEKMYAFAAYDLQHKQTALEEGEDIAVHPVSLDEALQMVRDGQIQDGKTIAVLLFHAKFRGAVK
jgi:ADP-ribose pyrophosphatase